MEDESAKKNEATTGKIKPSGKKANVIDDVWSSNTGVSRIILLIFSTGAYHSISVKRASRRVYFHS